MSVQIGCVLQILFLLIYILIYVLSYTEETY